jgi:trimethylamine--corrinoid protein Co-methyltransferase
MIQRYMEPQIVATTPDDIAFDAIKEVGPNGHFFGIQHTQDRYEEAFYQPFVSDWRNFEAWEVAGGVWTAERAHVTFKNIIANFEEPPMDVAIKEELKAFVDRRKAEGGAPTDF